MVIVASFKPPSTGTLPNQTQKEGDETDTQKLQDNDSCRNKNNVDERYVR